MFLLLQQLDVWQASAVTNLLLLALGASQTGLEVCWVAKRPQRSTANAAHPIDLHFSQQVTSQLLSYDFLPTLHGNPHTTGGVCGLIADHQKAQKVQWVACTLGADPVPILFHAQLAYILPPAGQTGLEVGLRLITDRKKAQQMQPIS